MSELENMKQKANKQVQDLINKNIMKKEWDVKFIKILKNKFLYIDCDTSKVDIKLVKILCSQHFTRDLWVNLRIKLINIF